MFSEDGPSEQEGLTVKSAEKRLRVEIGFLSMLDAIFLHVIVAPDPLIHGVVPRRPSSYHQVSPFAAL